MSQAKIPVKILSMVLETVLSLEVPTSSFNLRLVSRQFNSLVTPLLFHHIILNKQIIESLVSNEATTSLHKLQVAHNLREHTWHITLRGDLPKEHLGRVFKSLKHLHKLTIEWDRKLWPSPLINLIRCRPRLQLNLTNQELDISSGRLFPIIHPLQLKSIQIVNYSYAADIFSPFKHFLLEKQNLAVLHLTCTGPGHVVPDDLIHPFERMPAVKELVLDGYMWNHSPANAVRFWNWSRITHLELRRVPIVPFLSTVTPEHLVHLRTFKTDGFCPQILLQSKACELFIRLINGVQALEHLTIFLPVARIDEDLKEDLIHAISRHGKSIRSLEVRERNEDRVHFLMHVPTNDYVAALKSSLTDVAELSLDDTTIGVEKQLSFSPDSEIQDPADLDHATLFAGFRNLRRLQLRMKMRDVNKLYTAESITQATQNLARVWLLSMLERKEGAMFDDIWVLIEIFCDVSPNRNNILQRLVARLGYVYKRDLEFVELLLTGIDEGSLHLKRTVFLPTY